jgi:signal transduction histidine kinase
MDKSLSLTPGAVKFSPWLAALLGIVAFKAALSLSVKSVPFAYSYSGISYLLLLVLATVLSVRNAIQFTVRARPFWLLLGLGYGLWALHQSLDLYYELGLHVDVPSDSVADEVLFFHLVPIIAAVATLPNLNFLDGKRHRWILNTLLILGFWAFLYGFVIAPYKYFIPRSYGARFDILYLVENLALILMLGVVTFRAKAPWKMIYLHLLGASVLYALCSTVANIAIDSGGYFNGKLYGLGLTASACWFVWMPVSARAVPKTESATTRLSDEQHSQVSRWAMLSVVMISVPMVWESFHRNENVNIHTLRLTVATAAIVLLAGGAYLKEYLDKLELASARMRAEEAVNSLSGQLISAQEEERSRIAREIHDDYQQRLALISMELESLAQNATGDMESSRRLYGLLNRVAELGSDLHSLSHRLHSSTLDSLGLAAALNALCEEFSDFHSIEVTFVEENVPRRIPRDAALCLFRITQETLENVRKHSHAAWANVRLEGHEKRIHLSVSDSGSGFDSAHAPRQGGIGIRSMEERLRLVGGHLSILSKPEEGTRVDAWVPIGSVVEESKQQFRQYEGAPAPN